MTTRGNVGGVFTITMTAALWALSGGLAGAQTCGGDLQPPCPPPSVVTCTSPEGLPEAPACTSGELENECACAAGAGVYLPGQNVAKVFKFGNNNSIQVKFDQVLTELEVTVALIPTEPADFQPRVKTVADGGRCLFTAANRPYPPTPEIECNVTVDVDGDGLVDKCAVYRVSFAPVGYKQGPQVVGYTIGWLDPDVKKNKHDYMLLRDPDGLHPSEQPDDGTDCFSQDITAKLLRNYDVGTIVDPGLGGRTCCPSEYVVARQRVRPAR